MRTHSSDPAGGGRRWPREALYGGGLLLASLLLLLGSYRLPRTTTITPAQVTTILPGQGWYAVKHSTFYDLDYRWSNGASLLALPHPGNGAAGWRATLAAGNGRTAPVHLCLADHCTDLVVTAEPRSYHVLAPIAAAGSAITLQISSATTLEPNGRALGVFVGPQQLATLGPSQPPLLLTLLVLLCTGLLTVAVRIAAPRMVLLVPLLLSLLLGCQQIGLWRFMLLERLLALLSGLLIAGLSLAWWLRRARWPRRASLPLAPIAWGRADAIAVLLLVLAAVLSRLALVGLPDRVGDLKLFSQWAEIQASQGLGAAYTAGSDNMPGNLYLLWAIGNLAAALKLSLAAPLTYQAALLLKIPALLADIAASGLIYRQARHHMAVRPAMGLAIMYLLTPSLWLIGAWWGQTDALVLLGIMASLVLLDRRQGRWSWMIWSLTLLLKFQAVLVLPVLALWTLRHGGLRAVLSNGLWAAGVFAAGLLPMIVAGQSDGVYNAIFLAVERWPYPTIRAYNLWYLLTWGRGDLGDPFKTAVTPADTTIWWLGLSYRQAGFVALGAVTLLVSWQVLRSPTRRTRFLAAAALALAFFLLPTQIHERFLSFVFAPLALACIYSRQALGIYLVLAVTHLLNIFRALYFLPALTSALRPQLWAVGLAIAQLAVLLYALWLLRAPPPGRSEPAAAVDRSPVPG